MSAPSTFNDDIGHGRVRLSSPCAVPWESMTPVAGGNRHCGACSKVVHDITGMSPEAIVALLQSDPGNICVNFVAVRVNRATMSKPVPRSQPRRSLRYVAATAAALLLGTPWQAAPMAQPRTEWVASYPPAEPAGGGNTLVTGVVVEQNGNLVAEDIEVVVRCEGVEVARLLAQKGLFSVDLTGKVLPESMIEVAALAGPRAQSQVDASESDCPATLEPVPVVMTLTFGGWSAGSVQVRLADAQNVSVQVTRFPELQLGPFTDEVRMGGVPPIIPDISQVLVLPQEVTLVKPEAPLPRQERDCGGR